MKRKRIRLERIFDKLWDAADKIITKYDPCEVKIGKHGASCLKCRVKRSPSQVNVMCCNGCQWHSSDRGCTAYKPLACRTWLCGTAARRNPKAFQQLRRIAIRAERLGLYVGRGDREESIINALIKQDLTLCFGL